MRILLLLSLLILSAGSSCLDSQTVLPGQLGQITDASVASCLPYKDSDTAHQCLLIANPYQGAARVFDAMANQFVLSPIGYFPLAVASGKAPNQVATLDGKTFVLDPVTRAIYEIPSSLISPLAPMKGLDFTPNLFVLTKDDMGKIWALVSDNFTIIHAVPLEAGAAFSFDMGMAVNLIQVDLSHQYFFVASGANLFQFAVGAIFTAGGPKIPEALVQTSAIRAMAADATNFYLSLAEKKLVVYSTVNETAQGSMTLDAVAQAIYLPGSMAGTPTPCCNGAKEWIAVLLTNGGFQYLAYTNGVFGETQKLFIPDDSGISSFALSNPIKLLGVNATGHGNDGLGCERRLFLVYSGTLLNTCEGSRVVKRLDQMAY
ncbi:MAG: hypothetical protein V4534_06815 [Myxococcota bacterium]